MLYDALSHSITLTLNQSVSHPVSLHEATLGSGLASSQRSKQGQAHQTALFYTDTSIVRARLPGCYTYNSAFLDFHMFSTC